MHQPQPSKALQELIEMARKFSINDLEAAQRGAQMAMLTKHDCAELPPPIIDPPKFPGESRQSYRRRCREGRK